MVGVGTSTSRTQPPPIPAHIRVMSAEAAIAPPVCNMMWQMAYSQLEGSTFARSSLSSAQI